MREHLNSYINSEVKINEQNDLVYNESVYIMNYSEKSTTEEIANLIVKPNGSVLNVGYGLGFFDKEVQRIGVSSHTIIECHPQVIEICDLNGVQLIFTTWQEAIPNLIEQNIKFDTIWFDTFIFNGEECFEDEWCNFASTVPNLLNDDGIVSMFMFKFPNHRKIKLQNYFKDFTEYKTKMTTPNSHYENHEFLYWKKS